MVERDYLLPHQEEQILMLAFAGKIEPLEAKAMVHVATAIRDAFKNNEVPFPISTRDLRNWCEKYVIWGDLEKAAKFTIVNRSPFSHRSVYEGLIRRAFDVEDDS